MKKNLISLLACLFASSAIGCDSKATLPASTTINDTKLKVEALFNFQSGYSSQNHLAGNDKFVSGNRKKLAFYTEAFFGVTLEQDTGDLVYGAKLALIPTTKAKTSASYNGSHIYLKSDFGKVELGSPHDAGSKLRVIADDIGAGGDWSRYVTVNGKNVQYKGLPAETIDYKEYFFDSVFKTKLNQINDKAEPARKISYYIPEYRGFNFGISYIPDSGNSGGSLISPTSAGLSEIPVPGTKNTYVINRNVTDAFSLGASYKHNLAENVALKVALTGEYGKSAGNIKLVQDKGASNEVIINQYKLSNLRTFNLGAILTYGNFSYGASYGSLGKSLTSKEFNKTGQNRRYYNGAIAYDQGPIKTSISYFRSNQFRNTLNSTTLASQFKLAPGLVPYAEISRFDVKGRPSLYPEAPIRKTKGTVAVLGAKLKI